MNGLQLLAENIELFKQELEAQSLINLEPWSGIYLGLSHSLEILNTANSDIDNYKVCVKHPIEQLCLENLTLALHEQGMSYKDIAEYHRFRTFQISTKEVKEWIENYSSQTVLAKVDTQFGSIFDTQYQLQNLFDNISTSLKEIELKTDKDYFMSKSSKDEIYLAYLGETRQIIKDAASLTEAIANLQNIEQFQKIVLEAVNQVDPRLKREIVRKWKQQKELSKGFI